MIVPSAGHSDLGHRTDRKLANAALHKRTKTTGGLTLLACYTENRSFTSAHFRTQQARTAESAVDRYGVVHIYLHRAGANGAYG